MKKSKTFDQMVKNSNKKVSNINGLTAVPQAGISTGKKQDIAYIYPQINKKTGQSLYRYKPASIERTIMTDYNKRGPLKKEYKVAENSMANNGMDAKLNATHQTYQEKLNQQLADIESKSKARQQQWDNDFEGMLAKYRDDIKGVQKNLSDKFPGIGKDDHKDEGGGGGNGSAPIQLPA